MTCTSDLCTGQRRCRCLCSACYDDTAATCLCTTCSANADMAAMKPPTQYDDQAGVYYRMYRYPHKTLRGSVRSPILGPEGYCRHCRRLQPLVPMKPPWLIGQLVEHRTLGSVLMSGDGRLCSGSGTRAIPTPPATGDRLCIPTSAQVAYARREEAARVANCEALAGVNPYAGLGVGGPPGPVDGPEPACAD